MCSAAIILTAASTAVGMASQYYQYKQETNAAQAAAEYNSQIAADQARTSNALAQNELAKGDADRERLLRQGAQHQGEMKSQLAASGFEMDSGSGLSLLADSAQNIQYDAQITSHNAAMNAWQHQAGANKALNEQNWQNFQYKQSKGSRAAQLFGMGGSLLGGIATGMNQWNQTA